MIPIDTKVMPLRNLEVWGEKTADADADAGDADEEHDAGEDGRLLFATAEYDGEVMTGILNFLRRVLKFKRLSIIIQFFLH